ncbi:MAG: exo-alpha-sialidase [Pirellulales bacterium]|nr:exo-alpha-sialidase [Pirellulales bacterium]
MHRQSSLRVTTIIAGLLLSASSSLAEESRYEAELVFPLHPQHNHAPGIVECPNGDLLVSWYRGSGERQADDVAVYGSRRRKGATEWCEPFVMVDTPGFPDGNTALWIDPQKRLWLFWPLVLANTWESCLTKYRWSDDYTADGCPKWKWQDDVPLKPVNFTERMTAELDKLVASRPDASAQEKLFVAEARKQIPDKLTSRLGWQTRCKPTLLPSGRILLPLYTDTFSVSLMAISDDQGKTWYASEPLVGYGNIQPTVLRRDDGTLVAYMRENGPRDHIRVCESKDDGLTWGAVGVSELENPGAGIDGVRLANGHWLLVYNDTTKGRNKLAVSISDDEGAAWRWTRHLEDHPTGSYHYPAVIQGADGTIHAIYSYFVEGGKSMKHAAFNEAWVQAGDSGK